MDLIRAGAPFIAVATVTLGATNVFGDATGMIIEPGDVESLNLGTEPWSEGINWGYDLVGPNAAAWIDEHWDAAGAVSFEVNVLTDGFDPDVSLTKSLLNDSGFVWTEFLLELTPSLGGPIVVDPGSVDSDHFDTFDVTNNPDGSASILYSGGVPVGLGDSLSLDFTFNVPADVAFTMVQTPLPTPGSLALLAVAGLIGPRRRRR
jgi:hypothetical protein